LITNDPTHSGQKKEQENLLPWQRAQPILEVLSSLSYNTGELDGYLYEIACSVGNLLQLDWTVVTLSCEGQGKVMASSLDLGEGQHIFSVHGTLMNRVVQTGRTLCVEDASQHPEYGCPPAGYVSYLGVPLRTYHGEVLGTICSFCEQPRLFTGEEVRTVELFAERAATAIDNYNMYRKQQQFNQFLEAEVSKRTEELRVAQAQLIEREKLAAIGEFASTIVHEIRNPVTTILMGLNYFKRVCVSDEARERVSLALEETDRLQNLLKEILLYAKPQVLRLEKWELNGLLAEMFGLLAQMPQARLRRLHFIPASEDIYIKGDKDKLKQVLINLVTNACEAIESGETVTCRVERQAEGVSFTVHNGGNPIPAEIFPKLTQPFCSTKSGGTGLGLAIVRRIVEAHGGCLSIESDKKKGTQVTVTILPQSV
jgi:signal transduction histidine kinase